MPVASEHAGETTCPCPDWRTTGACACAAACCAAVTLVLPAACCTFCVMVSCAVGCCCCACVWSGCDVVGCEVEALACVCCCAGRPLRTASTLFASTVTGCPPTFAVIDGPDEAFEALPACALPEPMVGLVEVSAKSESLI